MNSAALPTGTVVFLFSDVEGSTRRWDTNREGMRDALRLHDEILRFEIEQRSGYVFKTAGDAFCAAFWTIREALEAAVAAQRRLRLADFTAVDGLHVRMAVAAGETDERDGDYFGPAVNRTARLLSAAHGGQILVSGAVADSAMPQLAPEIALRHLGTLPLRDLREPERVYQLVTSDLPSEFKPLRALQTPPNNLPRQSTSFVGRHDDLIRVESLLERNALVTIVGAGGIGKTRLAIAVAAARLNDEPDGVWLVDLSSITGATLIPGAILAALGAERSTDTEALAALLSYLEKRQLLLLLDNSEHLVAEVAAIVAEIVAHCPHVTILATSREAFDLTGERLYHLATLDPASAAKLFNERAWAVDPGFDSEASAAYVDEICRRVDGIALAIELAAARVRAMPVRDLAKHLELRVLAGGRDRRPRQQTMRGLIDWSYDLLDEEEREVLRRCAVFVRGFTLDVGSRVYAPGGEARAFDPLASLVDKSLVIRDGHETDQRYRLLEPIREYAAEKLADARETPETLRRHAGALAMLARAAYEEWDLAPQPDWLSRLERDLSNLRVALRWTLEEENDLALGAQLAADATPLFLRLALLSEGIEWCERVLSAALELSAGIEGRLRYGLSMLYSNIGANKKVLEQALLAVERYREAGDSRGLARALSQVAARHAGQSRGEDAKIASEEALRLARGLGDRRLIADTLRRCAVAFAGDGPSAVRGRYEESVSLFRSLGRDDETARALEWWGQWEADAGDVGVAIERLLEARTLKADEASRMYLAANIASCYLAAGDRVQSETYAREAVTLAAKARHGILVPLAISYLAIVAGERDAVHAALLAGYAEARLRAAEWQRVGYEEQIVERFLESLRARFTEAELARLLDEGAAWSEEEAVARALSPSTV